MLIHIGSTPRERPRPLFREDPPWIQEPFTGRSPCGFKTSSRRRTAYPCMVLSCPWIVYILLCIRRSSVCVIILVGLSVLLCPPCDFPLVSLLVFFVFIAGSAPFVKDRPIRVPPYMISPITHPLDNQTHKIHKVHEQQRERYKVRFISMRWS